MTLQPNASSPKRRSRRSSAAAAASRRRGGGQHKPVHVAAEPTALGIRAGAVRPGTDRLRYAKLDARLLNGIRDLGWAETRPVQSGVIPLALAGDDVIACAETGTGKTAAFLVPILQRFLREGRPSRARRRTRALILAPTRELAVQIEDQVQGLTYHTTISSVAVFGGVPMTMQEQALQGRASTSSSRRRAG